MIELVFAVYLVLILPARQLYKSLKPRKDAPPEPRVDAYARTSRWLGLLLLALVAVLVMSDRSAADIGLDMPVSVAGRWGLVFCAVLACLPFVWTWMSEQRAKRRAERSAERSAELPDADKTRDDAALRTIEKDRLVPTTPAELRAFILMSLLIGFGWELLYRGFLMLVLPPFTGTAGAVILASLAYGIGHGYQSPGQLAGSVLSAFVFTLSYVATGSLWWLMVLHAGLPLFIGLSGYNLLRQPAPPLESGPA